MINILILLTALVSLTTTAAYSAPKVTYIDAPNFPGQIIIILPIKWTYLIWSSGDTSLLFRHI